MSTPNSSKPDELSFEQAMQRLETLAAELERDDVDLESALRAYEEGVSLARYCSEKLEAAELRVQELNLD